MCNTCRTWALLGEAGSCVACASCPTYVSQSWCFILAFCASVQLVWFHSRIWTFLYLNVALGSFMLPRVFLHRLSANLSGRRARSMECNTTSGLRFRIWKAVRPNFCMNFLRDLSSACHRLAKVAEVMRWDLLVVYYALKHLTKRLMRVLKLSMDLGGSPMY